MLLQVLRELQVLRLLVQEELRLQELLQLGLVDLVLHLRASRQERHRRSCCIRSLQVRYAAAATANEGAASQPQLGAACSSSVRVHNKVQELDSKLVLAVGAAAVVVAMEQTGNKPLRVACSKDRKDRSKPERVRSMVGKRVRSKHCACIQTNQPMRSKR